MSFAWELNTAKTRATGVIAAVVVVVVYMYFIASKALQDILHTPIHCPEWEQQKIYKSIIFVNGDLIQGILDMSQHTMFELLCSFMEPAYEEDRDSHTAWLSREEQPA